MLTIKAFSRITAIPETTLRYYEQTGLLIPADRAAMQAFPNMPMGL